MGFYDVIIIDWFSEVSYGNINFIAVTVIVSFQ